MRKLLAALALGLLAVGVVTILAMADPIDSQAQEAPPMQGSVYYLNFKPEQSAQWSTLAQAYTRATGVPVTVVTAASGTYEDTLRAEMVKNEPPTLFQVNGPVTLNSWKSYCLDLRDTALVQHLKSDEFALKDGEQVLGVAYAIESYGLICNRTLLGRAGYRPEEITSFAKLKSVAEDIQSRRQELGVLGAFASSGMDPSSDWRFKTHLANVPIFYEYRDRGVSTSDELEGTYVDNYRQLFDLYIHNATCEPEMVGARTGEDAASEFALGEAVFYQNGTWAYQDVIAEGLKDSELAMIPLYMGIPGEETQGLCTGSENYWCINRRARPEDIEATKAFVDWLITSSEGRYALSNDMGFITPFDTFTDAELPQNSLQQAALSDLSSGREPVGWAFTTIPSENWKTNVGAALLEYAQGSGGWETVESALIDGWAREASQSTLPKGT